MNEKIKILIGDDTAQFGVSVASKLRTDGFYVITRPKNGTLIADAVESERPDVVIVDALMPGLDAIGVIKKINSSQSDAKPYFIVTASYVNDFLEQQVM